MPTAEIDGRRVAFETFGSEGPWVSIIHGGLAASVTWRSIAERLGREVKVLTYDLRGYGLSDRGADRFSSRDLAADLRSLWDAVGIEGSFALGFSAGGCVAQHLVELAPERLEGLLLESTTAKLDPAAADGFLRRAASIEGGGAAGDVQEHLERAFSEEFRTDQPELVAEYAAVVARVDPLALASTFRALGEHDGRGLVATAKCPMLVLRGAQDQGMHAGYLREIGELNGQARAVVLPSAGHTMHLEAPAPFCHLVADFVKG